MPKHSINISKSDLEKLYITENKTTEEIGRIIGCSGAGVRKKLKKYNILIRKTGYRKSTPRYHKYELDKNWLYQEYITNRKSAKQIGRENKIHHNTITRYLKKHNIVLREKIDYTGKYTKDESFFNKGKNAYWAGFIASDGCVTQHNNGANTIHFGIHIQDKELLEQFIEQIKYTGKLKNSIKNTSELSIGKSQKLIKDLNKYWNITPKKSLTLKPPNITDKQLSLEYIIGIIDGDGSICFTKSKNCTTPTLNFSIVGTRELMQWISDILYNLEDNKYKQRIPRKMKGSNCFCIDYKCNRAYKILKILSKIETPYKLKRKWDKIQEYENIIQQKWKRKD